MANECVRFAQENGVATVTLNRPEKLNALDDVIRQGLADALTTVERDPTIRVAVITGAGRGFSAGGDIQRMVELKEKHQSVTLRSYLQAGHDLIKRIRRLPKPVIASINGVAAGAGVNLALACDLRMASEQATFTQAFVRIGLHPDWGGTFFLPRLIGMGRAMEMFLLGEAIGAAEALRIGLVNFVVPSERLTEEAARLAQRLAATPPLPVALLKQNLYERHETEMDLMMEAELAAQTKCFESEDFAEGLRAFFEKREPKFTGD